jgi:hypothetical protein
MCVGWPATKLRLVTIAAIAESRRRTSGAAASAATLHVLLLLALRLSGPPRTHEASTVRDAQEVEIDLRPESPPSAVSLVRSSNVEPNGERAQARSTSAARRLERAPEAETEREPRPAPPSSSTPLLFYAPPPFPLGVMGNGERNSFLPRHGAAEPGPASTTFRSAAPDAPSIADAKRAAEGAIKSELRERDRDVGLTPEGPILTALKDATYASSAPERGRATFAVIIDAEGLVVELRLVGASGNDVKSWDDALAHAKKALASSRAKLTMRGAGRTELRIEVTSDVVLPSGRRPDSRPVAPVLSASKVTIVESAPDQGVTAGLPKTSTVGTFELADIAAKPRRVVHTRVVSLSER